MTFKLIHQDIALLVKEWEKNKQSSKIHVHQDKHALSYKVIIKLIQ